MDNKDLCILMQAVTDWKDNQERFIHSTNKVLKQVSSEKYKELIHYWRGMYYFSEGKYEHSKSEFRQTDSKWLEYFFPPNEYRYEVEKFIFHFVHDISVKQRTRFIHVYQKNYDRLAPRIYNGEFPKKIDVYIYTGENDSLGNKLCYADRKLLTINTTLSIKGGHELAHILLGYRYSGNKINEFLDEGLATWLDLDGKGWFRFAHDKCQCKLSKSKIENYVSNERKTREYYYVAGLTAGYLYKHPEIFERLIGVYEGKELINSMRMEYSENILEEIERHYCNEGL